MAARRHPVKLIYSNVEITLYLTKTFIKNMCIRYTCKRADDNSSYEFKSLKEFCHCLDRAEKEKNK